MADSGSVRKKITVHVVNEVYIYIPAELSAAGFEIKIAGSLNITDEVRERCAR